MHSKISLMRSIPSFLAFLSLLLSSVVACAAVSVSNEKCTEENTLVRKEWSDLTKPQRREYIDAVLCMQHKPSQLPHGLVEGAKSRADDFLATHINQTLSIHISGIFMQWHREFVNLWEQAIRTECGYRGAVPYWNWPKYIGHLENSTLFDGSEYSLSGNGKYQPNAGPYHAGPFTFPHGTGGGCVLSGPFVNQTVNLGPFAFGDAFAGVLPSNWTAYNPRCLRRDLNDKLAHRFTRQSHIDKIFKAKDMRQFQARMGGIRHLGPHGGGHFVAGLSLQDFFASPADPSFFLHHSQIERIWTQWQARDPHYRQYGEGALNGTTRIFNPPDAPTVELDTKLNFGYLRGEMSIRELQAVGKNGFCYRYE